MNKLYEKVKERLSLIDNMYDIIRIIDPINNNVKNIGNNEITIHKEKCYELLANGKTCNNCISMRAYIEKDTFVKVECISNKVMLIVATPVNIDKEIYVVEIIKEISSNRNHNFDNNIKTLIDSINEKIVTDESTGTYNDIYEERRNKEIKKDKKLSILNYRIQELRNVLNEMSISSEDKVGYRETLKISEELDELIVEYMNNIL